MRVLCSLVTVCALMGAFAQYDQPLLWPFKDLQNLKGKCVFVWSLEANDKGRIVGDSLPMYCMCYDSLARRLEWMQYGTVGNWSRKPVMVPAAKGQKEFDQNGFQVSLVERQSMPIGETAQCSGWSKCDRSEQDLTARVIRRVQVLFRSSGNCDNGPSYDQLSSWSIDSLAYEGSSLIRTIRHASYLTGAEVLRFDADRGMRTQTTYAKGRRTASTTWIPDDSKPILVVDSVFFQDSTGTMIGRRQQEERLAYQNGRLVDHEIIDWSNCWNEANYTRLGSSRASFTKPPLRRRVMYEYHDGLLFKEIEYHEGQYRMDSIVYYYVDGLLSHSSAPTPRVVRRPDGLPTEYWPNEKNAGGMFCYRLAYIDERPQVLPVDLGLEWLRSYEPK